MCPERDPIRGQQWQAWCAPSTGSRLMAMLSTAMLDTLAAFGDQVDFYRIDQNAPTVANMDAALLERLIGFSRSNFPGRAALSRSNTTSASRP